MGAEAVHLRADRFALAEASGIWHPGIDDVALTTVGIDVGSSTFHLMFAQLILHRQVQRLSARFEVIARDVIWTSDVCLTPYDGTRIDADAVRRFVRRCHRAARLDPEDVDTGAVILTGEALRKHNARPLADAIADGSGKFVCVSAGHHLEAMLAAQGSGALEHSRLTQARILHVDIGGGTTKLAFVDGGEILATAALAVGGRQVCWDAQRRIVSLAHGAVEIGESAGVGIGQGEPFPPWAEKRFVAAQTGVLFDVLAGRANALSEELWLTAKFAVPCPPDEVTFSGGVSEYVFGRETTSFADLGLALGSSIAVGVVAGMVDRPVVDPGEGIRATVAGASQCSVQLSGSTVLVSDERCLPARGIPVVRAAIAPWQDHGAPDPVAVTVAVRSALDRHGMRPGSAVALSLPWRGDPSYQAMRAVAQGVSQAVGVACDEPVVILVDDDVAASLGHLLITEAKFPRPLVCLDGLELKPFDHVDVGEVLQPSGALPVVIKSLLFADGRR